MHSLLYGLYIIIQRVGMNKSLYALNNNLLLTVLATYFKILTVLATLIFFYIFCDPGYPQPFQQSHKMCLLCTNKNYKHFVAYLCTKWRYLTVLASFSHFLWLKLVKTCFIQGGFNHYATKTLQP